MEDPRANLSNDVEGLSETQKNPDLLVGKSTNDAPQTYIPSDSDSDVDENGTPPTIIKRKSEVPR
jgi:hypothetical protein